MQLYAITDRKRTEEPLPGLMQRWSRDGVDFIQLREKDLDPEALAALTRETKANIHPARSKLLVNVSGGESVTAASEAGADGVHLAGKPEPGAARRVRDIWKNAIISLPCHSLDDVAVAAAEPIDLILFSPVFEKVFGEIFPAQGLDGLRQACATARDIPVFALGGVTAANAADCVAAGAKGVAAIRLFAGDDWRQLARPSGPEEPYIVR
jgi:thiamine-phosphate pyrophosphorylase